MCVLLSYWLLSWKFALNSVDVVHMRIPRHKNKFSMQGYEAALLTLATSTELPLQLHLNLVLDTNTGPSAAWPLEPAKQSFYGVSNNLTTSGSSRPKFGADANPAPDLHCRHRARNIVSTFWQTQIIFAPSKRFRFVSRQRSGSWSSTNWIQLFNQNQRVIVAANITFECKFTLLWTHEKPAAGRITSLCSSNHFSISLFLG